MATISTAERTAIIDALLGRFGEDASAMATLIKGLGLIPGITVATWVTLLRSRAAVHAPFIASGLSITWWCDEVARLTAT